MAPTEYDIGAHIVVDLSSAVELETNGETGDAAVALHVARVLRYDGAPPNPARGECREVWISTNGGPIWVDLDYEHSSQVWGCSVEAAAEALGGLDADDLRESIERALGL